VHRSELERQIAAIATLHEPVRRGLYLYVARRRRDVGRDEAARALRISRALAAFHLDKLVRQGLLETSYRRLTGRRRPPPGPRPGSGRAPRTARRRHGARPARPPARRAGVVRLRADPEQRLRASRELSVRGPREPIAGARVRDEPRVARGRAPGRTGARHAGRAAPAAAVVLCGGAIRRPALLAVGDRALMLRTPAILLGVPMHLVRRRLQPLFDGRARVRDANGELPLLPAHVASRARICFAWCAQWRT